MVKNHANLSFREAGYRANPLVANSGADTIPDENNDVDLSPNTPMAGRYLHLLRTGSVDPNDLQLRVDEVNVFECEDEEGEILDIS